MLRLLRWFIFARNELRIVKMVIIMDLLPSWVDSIGSESIEPNHVIQSDDSNGHCIFFLPISWVWLASAYLTSSCQDRIVALYTVFGQEFHCYPGSNCNCGNPWVPRSTEMWTVDRGLPEVCTKFQSLRWGVHLRRTVPSAPSAPESPNSWVPLLPRSYLTSPLPKHQRS
jgi:hypothetical protein